MQRIAALNRKNKALFGAGLLALIIIAITIGIYSTNRADANQPSATLTAPNAMDTSIEINIENGLMEPESMTSTIESSAAANSSQRSEPSATNSDVDVHVDGMSVDVPENGTVRKEVVTENGSTRIDISSRSNTSSNDSGTKSSIKVDFDSSVRTQE